MTLTVFSPPLTGRRAAAGRLLAATVLAGQAMASLDTAIVNVAGEDFCVFRHNLPGRIHWMVSSTFTS